MRLGRIAWAQGLVGLTLVVAALALGGAYPQVVALLLVPALAALLLAGDGREGGPRLWELWIGRALLLMLVLTALQLVPLPRAVLGVIAPQTLELARLAQGSEVGFAPLSLDPAATAAELAKLLVYLAVLGAALAAFEARRGERRLLARIVATGALVAAVGFAQMALGIHRPWNSFGPVRPLYTATLVNLNHLAGFLGLTALIGLALALAEHGRRRWLWALLGGLAGSGVFLSLSRGGILAFVLALLILAALAQSQRLGERAARVAVLGVLALAAGIATYLAYSRVVHELWTLGGEGNALKAEIWLPVPRMLADYPVFGIGRGAFASIYPHYKALPHTLTFTHLENEWLQLLVDFGPVWGVALWGLLTLSFLRLWRFARRRRWRLGLAGGLVFIGLHNLMDFSLTLPAVALPVVLVLGIEEARARAPRQRPPHVVAPRWLTPRHVALVLLSSGVGAGASWAALDTSLARDTATLGAQAHAPGVDAASLARSARPLMRRHPADYLLPLVVAEALVQRGEAREALAWVNHGLYLAPWYYGGHVIAARALLRLGAGEQAALEYRLAAEALPERGFAFVDELWRRTHDPALLQSLAARATPSLRLVVAALLAREKRWSEVDAVLEASPALEDDHARRLAIQAAMGRGEAARALTLAQELTTHGPQDALGYGLQADAYLALGERDRALAILQQGLKQCRDPGPLIGRTIQQLVASGAYAEARALAARLLGRTLDSQQSASAHALLATIYEREGRPAQALREYAKARDRDPVAFGYRRQIASLREKLGDYDGALRELARAEAELGTSSELRDWMERLKRARDAQDETRRRELLLGR